MSARQYIIVSDCWYERKPLKKGTIIELDIDDPLESQKIAMLNHAGRIGLATPENVKAIKDELASEQRREERVQEMAKRAEAGAGARRQMAAA